MNASTLYQLDFDKISGGCQDKWFGSTDISQGTSPKKIVIDESEPLHLVQILYMLKEQQWNDDHWTLFTKKDLLDIIELDENKNIYLEEKQFFGQSFMNEFPHQTHYFVTNFCKVVGEQ
jgi:hypothetical protein